MTDTNSIDPDALERLREWGGDKLLSQMVRLFLKNAGVRMEQIRAGVGTGDIAESERGAHSLKSSAANIGAERVRALTGSIEAAAGDGDSDTVASALPELEVAFAAAISALQTIAERLPEETTE